MMEEPCRTALNLSSSTLQLDFLLGISTCLDGFDEVFDITTFRPYCLICFYELFDPLLGQEGEGFLFLCNNVSVVVEDGDFILCWLFLMFQQKLLNVFAAFKDVLLVTEPKDLLSPLLPTVSLTQRKLCSCVYHYFLVAL